MWTRIWVFWLWCPRREEAYELIWLKGHIKPEGERPAEFASFGGWFVYMPLAACVGALVVPGVAVLRGRGATRPVVRSVYENLGFRALVSTPRGSQPAGLARFSLQTKEKKPSGTCRFRRMVHFHAYGSMCGRSTRPGCGCASRAGSHVSGCANCGRESGFSGSGVHAARKPTS